MKKKSVAVIRCSGSAAIIQSALEGQSGPDCAAIKTSVKALSPEGIPGACAFGCLGGGSCAAACPLKAITLKEKGPASVDQEKCVGCGKCARLCPLNVIRMEGGRPAWRGKACAHCMSCIQNCPAKAIEYGQVTPVKARYRFEKYRYALGSPQPQAETNARKTARAAGSDR